MKLLLDTHILLWWIQDSRLLKQVARDLISTSENQVFVSAATAWEIEIKRASGKLDFVGEVSAAVTDEGFKRLDIHFSHASETRLLPLIHTDPFDRMLVAQARLEEMHLLSVDARVLAYPAQVIDCR